VERCAALLILWSLGCAPAVAKFSAPLVLSDHPTNHPDFREVRLSGYVGDGGETPVIVIRASRGQVAGIAMEWYPDVWAHPPVYASDTLAIRAKRAAHRREGCKWERGSYYGPIYWCPLPFRAGQPDWARLLARVDSFVSSPMPEPPSDPVVRDSVRQGDGTWLRHQSLQMCSGGLAWTLVVRSPHGVDKRESFHGAGESCWPSTQEHRAFNAFGWSLLDEVLDHLRALEEPVRQ
jgi:hypothetical protein